MNKIFDFIKNLSENDKKSLSQKALKAAEEVGELAKVILPYENASGSFHKFGTKEAVLEEICDVILTALSIGYDLKFNHEEILNMIEEKSKYWASLQAGEDNLKFPIPYEIHVTIEHPEYIDTYKDVCKKIGVKPIVLDLENNDYKGIDVMTSSVFYGDNRTVYDETERIAKELSFHGYNVIRKKIETVPFHPAAPRNSNFLTMPKNCYFECHLSVKIHQDDKHFLEKIANEYDAHLSKNFFKKLENFQVIQMMTLRAYKGNYDAFKTKVKNLKTDLRINHFNYEKDIIEFCIYDTKISHDYQWLNKEEKSAETAG